MSPGLGGPPYILLSVCGCLDWPSLGYTDSAVEMHIGPCVPYLPGYCFVAYESLRLDEVSDKTPTSLVGDHRSSFIESGMELFPVCEHVPTLCMHVMEVRVEVRGQL